MHPFVMPERSEASGGEHHQISLSLSSSLRVPQPPEAIVLASCQSHPPFPPKSRPKFRRLIFPPFGKRGNTRGIFLFVIFKKLLGWPERFIRGYLFGQNTCWNPHQLSYLGFFNNKPSITNVAVKRTATAPPKTHSQVLVASPFPAVSVFLGGEVRIGSVVRLSLDVSL